MNIGDLPEIKSLRQFFEMTTGATYPKSTLKRRMKLLTLEETKRCNKLWHKIEVLAEEIDDVISLRAELEHDNWP